MKDWPEVAAVLATKPPGTTLQIDKAAIVAPADAGAVRSPGLPRGEDVSWRFPPSITCQGLHVREYPAVYVAHLDRVHPDCDLVEHVAQDAPELVAGAIIGGFVGLVVGGRSSRVLGAALGGLAGVAATVLAGRTS